MQSMFAFPSLLTEEDRERCADWKLPLCFVRRRHLEAIEEPGDKEQQSWRMKERVSALVFVCLFGCGCECKCEYASVGNLIYSFCLSRLSLVLSFSSVFFCSFVLFSSAVMDQMKTVSVALVLCLNVGVDPPDVLKPSPCARMECWLSEFLLKKSSSHFYLPVFKTICMHTKIPYCCLHAHTHCDFFCY